MMYFFQIARIKKLRPIIENTNFEKLQKTASSP